MADRCLYATQKSSSVQKRRFLACGQITSL
jgi:hypothetical protein